MLLIQIKKQSKFIIMKKNILLILALSLMFSSKSIAQNLKNDCEFYKSTSFILTSINAIDEVLNSNDKNTDLKKLIPILETNNTKIEKSYQILKSKFSSDTDFVVYENWYLLIKKSSKMLKENDPIFELGLQLVKDDLKDFFTTKY
jgi:predicted nucleotidyltransferase